MPLPLAGSPGFGPVLQSADYDQSGYVLKTGTHSTDSRQQVSCNKGAELTNQFL